MRSVAVTMDTNVRVGGVVVLVHLDGANLNVEYFGGALVDGI